MGASRTPDVAPDARRQRRGAGGTPRAHSTRPMRTLSVVAVAWMLASPAATAVRVPDKLTPAEVVACKARGGRPEMVLHYVEACVWPTRDAGKSCRDKSDCEGFCEAPFGTEVNARAVGRCSREAADRAGGCVNFVERGRSTGDMCVH
jgi:hypothetical protein